MNTAIQGSGQRRPEIAFVVSGDRTSAMGIRARSMAAKLAAHYDIQLVHRSKRKLLSILAIFSFLARARPGLVYVFDISYTAILGAGLYKILFRRPLVIETGDAIVELMKSTGNRSAIGIWLTKRLENTAFSIADRVVVRGTFHQQLLRQRGIEADVIQDGVETDDFEVTSTNDLRERLGLNDALTIGLVGNSIWSEKLQMCYGWELVETLRLLQNRAVKGIMIGAGSGIAHLEARCREHGIEDKVLFLGHVPYEQLPDSLRLIDVCLSTQTNDVVGQVRTTGKLPLYLAANRYILASNVGEATRVLPTEMLVDYDGVRDVNYPQKLKERIEEILDKPEMLNRASAGVAIAREHFDYQTLAVRLQETIDALIEGSRDESAGGVTARVAAKSVQTQ